MYASLQFRETRGRFLYLVEVSIKANEMSKFSTPTFIKRHLPAGMWDVRKLGMLTVNG
jgi:hypothetical protein